MEQPPKDPEETGSKGPEEKAEESVDKVAKRTVAGTAEETMAEGLAGRAEETVNAAPAEGHAAEPEAAEPAQETVEEKAREAVRATDARLRLMIEKLVNRRAVAEEIMQEAHIRLLAQEPAKVLNPMAWVRKVATRLALNHLRKERRYVDLGKSDFSELPDFSGAPQQHWQKAELDEQLAKAIRGLLPEQVELVRLHYFQGLPLKEIARQWNITEGAVAHRVTRILIQCRQRLKKAGIDASELD
jgi:RNA polymerase sigma factor (sigma-70 family)